MAKILWFNWSGGGNLPPSLGIARELTRRGHSVAFAGRPEMVGRVQRAGLRAIELTRAYEQVAQYPAGKYIPRAACYLTSPAVAEQVASVAAAEAPDLVIVDAMFPAALAEAAAFACPVVVMCHTAVFRALDRWRQMLAMLVGLRVEAGFTPLPASLDALWTARDRVVVTTLQTLDAAPGTLGNPDRLRYVGPCLETEPHAQPAALPWPEDDPAPLVLVSFSTAPEQGSPAKFQTTIDALSGLPLHAVVTVGDSVDPALLRPAANVAVFATADHDALMRRASLVVTHGGHGTLMRALRHGLPLLVIPGMAHDQAVNAAAVDAWGVGRALPGDATAAMMATAVQTLLHTPHSRDAARAIAKDLAGVDGAAGAATEIEALLSVH
jgi:UDP:flavonoid glycosyltransferase YjiC (YdhE family)